MSADSAPTVTRNVLVVEDEPRLREMLLRAVREMEFTVRGAASAEEGLAELDREASDIVLVDLNLPGMHGLELCEAVRERWPTTQVVILTGQGDLDAAKRAMRLDVVDFLTKPCPLGDLEVALDRALRRRRHHIVPRRIEEGAAGAAEQSSAEEAASVDARTLEEIEREHIFAALARHDGNRKAAAEELGISVRTLYYRLRQYELQGRGDD